MLLCSPAPWPARPPVRPSIPPCLPPPNAAPATRYDKVHLVPVGEFVPCPFGLLTEKISTEAGDYAGGRGVVISRIGEHRIGTFICYESVFPSYIRQFAAQGAEALFNISNDAWFGTSPARYQHLRIVRMRAAELRRWIVRATNNGVTAAIDPAGRVIRSLPEYRQVSGKFPFDYRRDITFYASFGDWFVGVCFALGCISIWTSWPDRSSSPSPSSSSSGGATIE